MTIQFANMFKTVEDDNNVYINATSTDQYKSEEFNIEHFESLINNNQYSEAYNYAKDYHYNDPKKDKAFRNDLSIIRQEGRKFESQYNNTPPEERNAIDFYNAVFTDGGLNTLNSNNDYVKKFRDIKDKLGGEGSSALSITFAPKTRRFLGIDWLARDNENTFENFCEKLGYDEQALKDAGCRVIYNKDGSKELKFLKANSLANEIIYNITKPVNNYADSKVPAALVPILQLMPEAHMADVNSPMTSNDIVFGSGWQDVTIKGFDDNDNIIYTQNHDNNVDIYNLLNDYQNLIDDAKQKTDIYFAPSDILKSYSSTIGPALSDDLEILNKEWEFGKKDSEYYRKREFIIGQVEGFLKAGNLSAYEMYSNINNEDHSNRDFNPLDNIEKENLQEYLNSVKPENIHYNSMIEDGRIGLLVTIDPNTDSEDSFIKKWFSKDKDIQDRTIQFYIPEPDFCMETLQEKINNNTLTRAYAELNALQDYNYEYETLTGWNIKPDGLGNFIMTPNKRGKYYEKPKTVGKDEAVAEINKDLIVESTRNNLIYELVNDQNNLGTYGTDTYLGDVYYKQVQQICLQGADEIYPNVPLVNEKNEPVESVEELFNIIDSNSYMNMPYKIKQKYQAIKDMYKGITWDAKAYIKFPMTKKQ